METNCGIDMKPKSPLFKAYAVAMANATLLIVTLLVSYSYNESRIIVETVSPVPINQANTTEEKSIEK